MTMTDIKEIASEQLRQASWWGGAGQALPELYVEQLITEIDRLNKVVEQQRHLNIDLNLHPIGSKWTHLETGYPVEVIAHSGGSMVVENIGGYITGVWNDADFLAVSIKDLGHEEADRIDKESDNA